MHVAEAPKAPERSEAAEAPAVETEPAASAVETVETVEAQKPVAAPQAVEAEPVKTAPVAATPESEVIEPQPLRNRSRFKRPPLSNRSLSRHSNRLRSSSPWRLLRPLRHRFRCPRLKEEALKPMLETAGLVWVNTDADKLRAASEAAAQAEAPKRVPRERKPLPPLDTAPMQQVETGKDAH